jgi:hypothetical protein
MKFLLCAFLSVSVPLFSVNTFADTQNSQTKRAALQEKDKKEVRNVLAKNDLLFNAFLKKDKSLIEQEARELQKTLAGTNSKILEQVRKGSSALQKEVSMEAYEAFLNPMIQVVQKYDVGRDFNVFSCPMVNKSWIQDVRVNKGVKNVYAMEMLECGEQESKY